MNQITIPVRTSTGFSEIKVITNPEGIPVVTSLNVAEVFGKLHHHVMDCIKALECSEDFISTNFRVSSYKPERAKRSYPMYEMTRDGFTFLAMGFTGAKAAEFKEGYIKAFNQMEAHIRNMPKFAVPQTMIEAMELALTTMKENAALAQRNAIMAPKAKAYDQFMDADGTLNLTHAAKSLGFTSGRALGMYLRETLCWLFLDTKTVTPKAHVIEKGYMTAKLWSLDDRQKSGVQGRITAKGMEYLMNHFSRKAA